jgi:hypothetical protein
MVTISLCLFLLMVFFLAVRALSTNRRFKTGFKILGASFFFEADDAKDDPERREVITGASEAPVAIRPAPDLISIAPVKLEGAGIGKPSSRIP